MHKYTVMRSLHNTDVPLSLQTAEFSNSIMYERCKSNQRLSFQQSHRRFAMASTFARFIADGAPLGPIKLSSETTPQSTGNAWTAQNCLAGRMARIPQASFYRLIASMRRHCYRKLLYSYICWCNFSFDHEYILGRYIVHPSNIYNCKIPWLLFIFFYRRSFRHKLNISFCP